MRKFCYVFFVFWTAVSCEKPSETELVVKRIEKYYNESFRNYADWFALPMHYLQALAAVEVSGRQNIPQRFEEHVYRDLIRVKNGELKRFENITAADLKDTPDSLIKAMAKSWGPFQLMGYKCFYLQIDINELVDSSGFYGALWIDLSYGELVRKGDYKNAFHLHNTGKKYPENGPAFTYDSLYVEKAVKYLKIFKKRNKKRSKEGIRIELL